MSERRRWKSRCLLPAALLAGSILACAETTEEVTAPEAGLEAAITPRGNNASFIFQQVPTTLRAGQKHVVSIAMANVGRTTWTAGDLYRLGSQNPQDNRIWGIGRVTLAPGEQIPPNRSKVFTFEITAPTRPGVYNFQWRMVQELVEWFGASTENVRITVLPPADINAAQFISQSVPRSLEPGQTARAIVVMKNTGSTVWTRAGAHRLGSQNPQGNRIWGLGRVQLAPADRIVPGETKQFRFRITAPTEPGVYNFRWRMLQERVEWFGELTPNLTISVGDGAPIDNAQFVFQSVPSTLRTGQTARVRVRMINTGTTTWRVTSTGGNADLRTRYELGSLNPPDNMIWGISRVPVSPPVPPGETKDFEFDIQAPAEPGVYSFRWRMVKSSNIPQTQPERIGQPTPNVMITVEEPPTGDDAAFVRQSVPTTLRPSQRHRVTVTMRNTGATTWGQVQPGPFPTAVYQLGSQSPADNQIWGTARVPLERGERVRPRTTKTFSFEIQAPAQPGRYRFRWQMLKGLPVPGAPAERFGELTPPITISVRGTPFINEARIVSTDVPLVMFEGSTHLVRVTVRNTGTTNWSRPSYTLADPQAIASEGRTPTWGVKRISLGPLEVIRPRQTKDFYFVVRAPTRDGTYLFKWRMLHEALGLREFFGESTARQVNVVDPNVDVP